MIAAELKQSLSIFIRFPTRNVRERQAMPHDQRTLFPCQTNVYFYSLSGRLSAIRVSCNITLLIFSLCNSKSTIAVILESLIC